MGKKVYLPGLALAGGVLGLGLRLWQRRVSFDPETLLFLSGCPAPALLLALTAVVAAVLLVSLRRESPPKTAAEVLDSTGGEALNGVLAELGLRGLAYGELGFRYLTADRPVTTPEDLEGLRIRTAGLLELFESYIGCWGVRLYPSSYSDVMTPLSNGTYNGQESTLAEADAAGYQTVQTDVTIFPAFYEPAILTMNSDLYGSLSPELREAVDRCGREAMADQRLRNREQEAEILERWQEEDGISVHVLTEEQWGAFQTLTERLYDPEDPDHQDWFADCTPEWVEQFRPS